MVDCDTASSAQRWVYDAEAGLIRNGELCLHVSSEHVVSMQPCDRAEASSWGFNAETGQIQTPLGTCLKAPLPTASTSSVEASECYADSQQQMWSIGDYKPEIAAYALVEDDTVRDWSGRCLTATDGAQNGGGLRLQPCEEESEAQRWVQEHNALRNEACLDSPVDGKVHMWFCYYHDAQTWTYDLDTGLLMQRRGKCLEASGGDETTIHLAVCDPYNERQRWSIDGIVPPTPAPTTATATSTGASEPSSRRRRRTTRRRRRRSASALPQLAPIL